MVGFIVVAGRTFDQEEKLKKLGCRWDSELKAWVVGRAGLNGVMYDDKPRYDAVQAAIRRGDLRDVWLRVIRFPWWG